MAKKTKRQLEYEGWRRRLQSALIDLEGAASLWSGCVSEAGYCNEDEPQRKFINAMDDGWSAALNQVLTDSISERLWDLVEDMQKAIEDGEAGLKEPKEEEDGNHASEIE